MTTENREAGVNARCASGSVAQWIAHWTSSGSSNSKVAGSSPVGVMFFVCFFYLIFYRPLEFVCFLIN